MREQPTWGPEHAGKVADSFADYWRAKAGSGAVKLDWFATWRNWVRREKPAIQHAAQTMQHGAATAPKTCHCGAQGVVMRAGRWFCGEHEPKAPRIVPLPQQTTMEVRHVAAW